MKPIPLRALPLVQADLFDAATAPAPLTSLQLHRHELVELLSQLLWQVASRGDIAQRLEDADEQDQH
jgi:DNA-binding TFAR19-related protein (PDSD5 family)